jgi:predicted nucleic-acid-binding protein
MKGLDTNVLVRLLVADDPDQAERAAAHIATHCSTDDPGWINRVVLCELVWVLDRGYGYERDEIADALEKLVAANQIRVEDPSAVWAGLRALRAGDDFADVVIGQTNRAAGCEATVTFDRRAARLEGFEGI